MYSDSRGATSVVGVILMVATVVILAAVVGSYAYDVADRVQSAPPQAAFAFDWDQSTRTLTISHASGDAFTQDNTGRLEVVIEDEDETGQNDFLIARGDWVDRADGDFHLDSGDNFTVTGESGGGDLDVEDSGTNVENAASEVHEPEAGDTVTLVWYAPRSGQSHVLREYVIPTGEN